MDKVNEYLNDNINLDNPSYYNNRELSWLEFNKRVLQEAFDESNPLLERLNFLAICSSNLDEFFMVRVAGLKDQVDAGFNKPENKAGLKPSQQLKQISIVNHQSVYKQYECYKALIKLLEKENIYLTTIDELTEIELRNLEEYFDEYIFPVLTPLAIDAYSPFPKLLNKSINLAVNLQSDTSNEKENAIVQIPALLDRFIQIGNEHKYVLLEDVISFYLHKLFYGYSVLSISEFRITRNADLTIHEEGARDLLKEIEKELKNRKWGAAVRLEVREGKYNHSTIEFLLNVLEIHEKDLYIVDGPLDLTFLFKFYKRLKDDYDYLVYEPLVPQPAQDILPNESVFEAARKRDIFLHHPFESFEPVVELITEAAKDPNVLAIKQTLYRVSDDSPIIEGLKLAAENGKQVMVLVELKARFDEENNVQWAKELERAGCHVVYGIEFLKTHSKITLVVRKHEEIIERFVHLGTGNYNDKTAKIYTDMGIITTKRKFGVDATNFFNYISGFSKKPDFFHLYMAPFDIRDKLIDLIDDEIKYQKRFGNGHIIAKMNSLTDKKLIKKMYEASQAGVKIELIVRGVCCLRPGIEGVSDTITVRSIVGRFLEHSRIYYFHSNGLEKVYLSSADMMTRNMEKRIELMFPIYESSIKSRIMEILALQLKDNAKAREQKNDGSYEYVARKDNDEIVNSQMILFKMAYQGTEKREYF
ncbi:RNA degradosome polyphosphate kinase [Pallidibacillus pasinlerensis]|uniref:Polyphosphate kinase n=1 Tax=Pallidibacillus pasinlerensis TaxID=2703818 RepID=A0ABX0A6F4_9BACI|nr:RNA degradosome polyphosphate kinase [Pallidibacillus pasinlerensis]NCU19032.1 RNA degradosome polyphosphate kinase [Pallidibacillus pasinlerensis]